MLTSSEKPSSTTQNSSNPQQKLSEILLNDAADLAIQSFFTFRSEEEKEYIRRLAYLKSIDVSELDVHETLELMRMINEAAELGIEIDKEAEKFFSKFTDIVQSVAGFATRTVAATLAALI